MPCCEWWVGQTSIRPTTHGPFATCTLLTLGRVTHSQADRQTDRQTTQEWISISASRASSMQVDRHHGHGCLLLATCPIDYQDTLDTINHTHKYSMCSCVCDRGWCTSICSVPGGNVLFFPPFPFSTLQTHPYPVSQRVSPATCLLIFTQLHALERHLHSVFAS